LTIIATIVINVLANALPINGQNTGAISDRFQVYFVPAGYVFSIWGIIYIGLIAYASFRRCLLSVRIPLRQLAGGSSWWAGDITWIFLCTMSNSH